MVAGLKSIRLGSATLWKRVAIYGGGGLLLILIVLAWYWSRWRPRNGWCGAGSSTGVPGNSMPPARSRTETETDHARALKRLWRAGETAAWTVA